MNLYHLLWDLFVRNYPRCFMDYSHFIFGYLFQCFFVMFLHRYLVIFHLIQELCFINFHHLLQDLHFIMEGFSSLLLVIIPLLLLIINLIFFIASLLIS